MNNLFQYILESTILLTIFYLFYHILLRKEKCFQYNRIYLITTPILAILLPLLDLRQLIAGSENEVSGVLPSVVLPEVNFTTPSSTTDSLSGMFLFLGILYAIGFLFYAIRLAIHLIRINRLISENNHSITTLGSALVVPIEGEIPTFSFFNYIFWNEKITLTEQEKEQIYKHELVHISEKHSYDILYFEILSMIFWFNPVLLLFKRAITDTHEFIADSKVTLKFSGKSYAALLVKNIFAQMNLNLGSQFNKSQVSRRLKMLETNAQNNPYIKVLISVLVIPAVSLIFEPAELKELPETVITQDLSISNVNPRQEIFTIVEEQPVPVGGMNQFYANLKSNLIYPKEAKSKGISGKVFVQFIVLPNGELDQVMAVKGIDPACDKAAVAGVLKGGPWIPGKQRGRNVAVRMIIPVTFKLDDE